MYIINTMSSLIDIESKINSSMNDPNFVDLKQFKLIVKTKDKKTFSFFKNTQEKYCQLINVIDGIDFNDICQFQLIINNKLIDSELVNIKHELNIEDMDTEDCYIYKDNEIYLEFLKDNEYTNCYCYLKKLNSNKVFNTPPNY